MTYTACDLEELGTESGISTPFIWNDSRREMLRADLDAYFAHLYSLTRDELEYICDPRDVFGPNFPSVTFRVLRMKDEKQHGEYRTRRLLLEAYDKLGATVRFREDVSKRQSALPISREVAQTANS